MLNILPPPLRKLFGLPAAYQSPVKYPGEWALYSLAVHRLGINFETAKRLMEGGPMPRRYRYRHFTVAKKNGSSREIAEPGPDLKRAQRKILKLLLNKSKPHSSALGFQRKKSIADHAWAHAGAATIITADIQDFFPSTTRQRIKKWWHERGYSTLEVRLLTSLTTYRGSLPQGAPTSPALSNLINAELDSAIDRRVRESGGRYTRYSDDMVFSWPDGYSPPADFEHAVRAVLRQAGYSLHLDKGWHIWRRQEEPEVTGVVLTRRGKVDIPESMQRVIRILALSEQPTDQRRLQGYRGYQGMITRSSR